MISLRPGRMNTDDVKRYEVEKLLQILVGGLRPSADEILYFSQKGWQYGLSHKIGRPDTKDLGTASGSLQVDFTESPIQKVTLTGDTTFQEPVIENDRTYILIIKQDSTGGRKATWSPEYKWPDSANNELSDPGGAVDIVTFIAADEVLYGIMQKRFL